MLRLDQVSYRVGSATLVGDVEIDFRPGVVTAVLGPNGAGKTTLIRLLAGEIAATSGTVTLDETPLAEWSAAELATRRAVFTGPPDPQLEYRAIEVVAMGRHPHRNTPRTSDDGPIVQRAMELTDTTEFAGRPFATLSAGEQTRVALARLMSQDTDLLLLDEPTASLDVSHQERILRVLGGIAHDQARTVVVVLHDINAAAAYADRIVLLESGSVAGKGSPEAVLDADLLSSVYRQPMAVIPHPYRDCPLVLVTD